jgi:NAD(P)-dependent dehydrogenase (short-subunit alcohol dehydrogenase family)
MDRLKDKIALITGGAGSIGAATARLFVAEGARVVVSDLDAGALDAVVAELGPDLAAAAVADVTDSEQVRAAVDFAVGRFGGLDVAFANAGIFGEVAPIVDYSEDVFERVLAVNVRGPFHVAKHALGAMLPGGSLIFNSSVVGLTSDAGICAYATSKHALVGLMRTAAKTGCEPRDPGQQHPSGPGRQRVPAPHRDRGDGGERGPRGGHSRR